MTNKDFIKRIVELYTEASKITVDKGDYNIWRGVSHSISSKTEDLFALFVAQHLIEEGLEFIIDKTMSLKAKGQKTITFRPDLAIVKNDIITHIFDLKMDMGYKRRYHEMPGFQKEKDKFHIFRRQTFETIGYKTGPKTNRLLKISSKIINQIVVISEKNEGKKNNRTDVIASIEKLDWANIYYLTGGVHPNNYSNNTMDEIIINDSEFERLFKDIIGN